MTLKNNLPALGWIGTGVMGTSMCRHLLDAGFAVNLYSRTAAKAQNLVALGAQWCATPSDVTHQSDVVLTMLGYPQDVEDVYFSRSGILAAARLGHVFIDMTTTKPELAKKIFAAAKQKGATALDAPVSGGDVGAKNATLTIMVGGEASALQSAMPIFEKLGKTIVHQGEAGSGQHAKLVNQIVIAGTMMGVCEAIVYAEKAGLDLPKVLSCITKGAAGCWTLDNLAPRILKQDFAPGFFVDHFVKDMQIALEESRRMGLGLQGLELVLKTYERLQKMGYGCKGTQALYLGVSGEAK